MRQHLHSSADQQVDLDLLSVVSLNSFHAALHIAQYATELNFSLSASADDFFDSLALYSVLSDELEKVHARQKAIKDSLDNMNTQKHLEIGKQKINDVNRKKITDAASGRFSRLGLFTPVGHDVRNTREYLASAHHDLSFSDLTGSSSSSAEFISLDSSTELRAIPAQSSSYDGYAAHARRSLSSLTSSDGSLPATPNVSRDDFSDFADEVTPCLSSSQSVKVDMFTSSDDDSDPASQSEDEYEHSSRGYRRI